LFMSCTNWTRPQRHTSSAMCCAVSIRHKPRVQLWLSRSPFTFWFFLHANKYKLGAISIGACPFSHDECQKDALSPHPTVTTVEAWKSALSVESHGGSISIQRLSGSTQAYHSHLIGGIFIK
jgi:hypothetical protein